MIITAVFFLFYYKAHLGYYLFLGLVFLPAMSEDLIMTLEVFFLPWSKNIVTSFPSGGVRAVVVVVCWLITLHLLWNSLFKEFAFDGDLGDGVEDEGYARLEQPRWFRNIVSP